MHHHTRWFIYFLLLAFVLFMGYFLRIKLKEPSPYVVVTPTLPAGDPGYKEIKTNTTESYASFDISYPQFTLADAAFNKKIVDAVQAAKTEFAQNAADNWKAYRENTYEEGDPGQFPSDPYPMYVKWELVQATDHYISAIMRIGGYNGGAHGFENIISWNYDVKAQKELTLADMFPNDPDYLKTVSDYSRTALTKKLSADIPLDEMTSPEEREKYIQESIQPMIDAGTEPTLQNFSVFTFTDTNITLYFSQYQVAAYVYGEQQVTMPRK